jgi:hypothetical protein
VRYSPEESYSETTADTPVGAGQHARTLGDTFEDTVVLDAGRTPNEVRFGLGPGPGANGTFTRDTAARDARVETLFHECADLDQVSITSGTLTATITDHTRWSEILLRLFDAVTAAFVPRATPPDRQLERAQRELGTLTPDNSRDLARIIDATTSPDAAFRRIAIDRLAGADALAGRAPWRRGLEDSSRAVRRSTARALAATADPGTRDLLEQALDDADACVRYYAVCGLVGIGSGPSSTMLEAQRRDPDVRVRLAVEAAADGRLPA